jgi:L-lactate dehydrogenase complex protein LldF
MKIRSESFQTLAQEAMEDKRIQQILALVGPAIKAARDQAFKALDDPEGLLARGRDIRERSLANLPHLLEVLEEKVREAGGVVHWAETPERAREIVADLARRAQVRTVVKGKSMMSEEIALNDHLIGQGLEVWETDMGEFIVQLAGEPPYHLVGPAIHKTVDQIADLFAEKIGGPKKESPEQLTMVARKYLRDKFIRADMGITGANMAVAETGTIVLFENEGNIRLTVTSPRIVVSIMGIEKVVPTLEDMTVILELLPRSTTGQKAATYVSLLTGPRRGDEKDGPEEFHLILLDNGRSRILADPDLREILRCIRCGCCSFVCPVYQTVGGHSYGWVYSGPMGSVLTPQLIAPRLARLLPFACTQCGACQEICPIKIDLPKLHLALRSRFVEDPDWEGGGTFLDRLPMKLGAWFASGPGRYKMASWGARLLEKAISPTGSGWLTPGPVSRWSRKRTVPSLARPFSKRWPELKKQLQAGGERT